MRKRLLSLAIMLMLIVGMMPALTLDVSADSVPTGMWIEPAETNGIPARIDAFEANSDPGVYQLYLPGNADTETCFLSWDGDTQAIVDGTSYESGTCPIPPADTQKTYTFTTGSGETASYEIITYQGSSSVQQVFIDIDESDGKNTIEQMDGDLEHNTECTGRININGDWYDMPKIKGRGNATWRGAKDKKPYNVTLGKKINFPGINCEQTKKWSFLAEIADHSLLGNRSGYHLADELGIGLDNTSADVWMNGEYQGCYTVTPKSDSFVTKNGFLIEQDNYMESAVAEGGDPQFQLDGLKEADDIDAWQGSGYNRITVKKMGDNLLKKDGVVDESAENMEDVAYNTIKPWLQDAWDAIRSDTGYNSKGKYYTDYIDIESFARMYLMHEYVKSFDFCAGSILFHRDGMTDEDKLIAGPMWDLDNAMGSTCQNAALGQADDRVNGDRRSGEGHFIQNVYEYKTSIYKTLSKHADFMEEVQNQYNSNQAAFDSLPADTEQMINDIEASARMNHFKVIDLTEDYSNDHVYSSNFTTGTGQYLQKYLATTDSKSDWANYAANLKTYITTRSLWFYNNYGPGSVAPEPGGQGQGQDQGQDQKPAPAAVKAGDVVNYNDSSYTVTSTSGMTVAFTRAGNKKSIVVPDAITINGKTYLVTSVSANAFTAKKIRTVTIGKNVVLIEKNAFKGSKATKMIVKSKKLTKASVKGSLKGSKIKTVQVKVGKKKVNKKYVKKYKKIFTKKNAGKKVKVK